MILDDKYGQARRIIAIIKLFNKYNIMTSKEVYNDLIKKFGGISERSVQRDLKIIADEGIIECEKRGRNSYWHIKRDFKTSIIPTKIEESELLSFYILKAYLKNFKGTAIEKHIIKLEDKLEKFLPGEVIINENFFGDQNFGFYDYSDKHNTISKCINFIIEKKWIELNYKKNSEDKIKRYIIFPLFLYSYSGNIYLLAYNPNRKKNANFLIQNIIDLDEYYNVNMKTIEFDISKFRNERLAVFDGKIEEVKILIFKELKDYFTQRNWHSSQKFTYNSDGSVLLTLKVPISNELVAWICKYSNSWKVLEPLELIEKVKYQLKNALSNYN